MNELVYEAKTASRVYYVYNEGGLYTAHFKPVNPKTGRTWQAMRHLDGGDAYQVGKYYPNNGGPHPVIIGTRPTYEENKAAGYDWCAVGFSTRELAVALCEAHRVKAGLVLF